MAAVLNKILAGIPMNSIVDTMKNLWNSIWNLQFISIVADMWTKYAAAYKSYILLGVALVLVLFGQKLRGVIRFLGSVLLGMGAGAAYLAPVVAKVVNIPAWIVAIVCGVVAAILFKVVSYAAVLVAAAYATYDVVMLGMIKPLAAISGNMIIAGAAAAVVALIVIIFNKFAWRVGTSVIGGAIVAAQIPALWAGFAGFAGDKASLYKAIMMGVIGLVGFIIQTKTRKKY